MSPELRRETLPARITLTRCKSDWTAPKRAIVATIDTGFGEVVADLGGTCPLRGLTPSEARDIAAALTEAANRVESQ